MAYVNRNSSTSSLPEFNYSGSSFQTGSYDVSGLMFPADLDAARYGGNKVIFYINVSVDSKLVRADSPAKLATVDNVQRDMRGTLLGEKIGQRIDPKTGNVVDNANATALSVGAAVGLAGGAVGTALGISGGGLAGVASGGLAKYLDVKTNQGNASNQESGPAQPRAPTFTRPQKRLKSAIALTIPNNIQARYSVQWGEEDTAMFSAVTKGGAEIQNFLTSDKKAESAGAMAGITGEVLAGVGINNAPLGKAMGAATGIAANPKKEQSFKDVDFRNFTFDYQFSPKDAEESRAILNIIRTFKYHMHPEFTSEDKFLYIYPSEFDIVYYKDNIENLNIHRHASCVLTEMNVNYAPNGVFTTFPDGMPTFIQMSLTFRELQLLSKETIEKYT